MDLSIKALKKYAKRSLEMGYLRNHNVLSEFVVRLKEGRDLTEGQRRYAEAMAKQVGDSIYKKMLQWCEDVKNDATLRERLEVVSRYYLSSEYHRATATRVIDYLQAPEHLQKKLPYNKCRSMIENQYARNVWQSHKAEPKFKVGDLVSVRGGSPNAWLIIAIGAKPIDTSHIYNDKIGGTKKYDLLEVGGARMITRMEKNLKKHRVPKNKKRTKNVLPK